MSDLAPVLQGFFRVKLMQHKDASPHTISSYRDAWRLLLHYAQQVTGTPPEKMRLGQLDHELISGFLRYLETERGNSARTRNNRLAAIHSMFRYAALHAPDDAEVIQRVLAIESARTDDTEIPWLTRWSRRPCSTGCCTDRSSSPSPASPTGCAPTAPAPASCAAGTAPRDWIPVTRRYRDDELPGLRAAVHPRRAAAVPR